MRNKFIITESEKNRILGFIKKKNKSYRTVADESIDEVDLLFMAFLK